MRVFIFFILLMSLSACERDSADNRSSPSLSGQVRSELSATQFTVETEAGETITVKLAEVRASDDEETRLQAVRRLSERLEEAGDNIRLESPGAIEDRYGRRLAHAYTGAGSNPVWLQARLVSEGWLIVSSYSDNYTHARTLYVLENEAREAGRGGWQSGGFEIRNVDPNNLVIHLDSYQIIQGRVMDVSPVINDQIFLNFGFDWRSDFTVMVPEDSLERFISAEYSPEDLKGETIRVRGWLYESNGPMIRIDHPEAIERLEVSEPPRLPGLEP